MPGDDIVSCLHGPGQTLWQTTTNLSDQLQFIMPIDWPLTSLIIFATQLGDKGCYSVVNRGCLGRVYIPVFKIGRLCQVLTNTCDIIPQDD